MQLADFDYDLPDDRIAQSPIEPRDAARLLIDRGASAPTHAHVRDLVDHLRPGDVLVVNDSKVIPARLRLHRHSGGAAEVLLLAPIDPLDADKRTWEALVRPARKLRVGEQLFGASDEPVVEIGPRLASGDTFAVTVLGDGDVIQRLATIGEMPLPPYITTPLTNTDRYQTVYAATPGSAAAPTAGLHFTPELLERIAQAGIAIERVELIVGLDTFQPMSVDNPLDHRIHSERYRVPQHTLDACRDARRVVAVGTTATRALESAATTGALEGDTRLFIHRGYEWKLVDVLMTNFHLPRTTLLVMIDAFIGERWKRLYADALELDYRMLSFGDAMLLDRSL